MFKSHLKWKTCRELANGLTIHDDDSEKIWLACFHPGAIYMYITIIFKELILRPLGQLILFGSKFHMKLYNKGGSMCL